MSSMELTFKKSIFYSIWLVVMFQLIVFTSIALRLNELCKSQITLTDAMKDKREIEQIKKDIEILNNDFGNMTQFIMSKDQLKDFKKKGD